MVVDDALEENRKEGNTFNPVITFERKSLFIVLKQ